MAYTTIAKVEGVIGRTIPAALSATVNDWIAAVTVWINNYCKTSFETGVAETRYYDSNGGNSIIVDDFVGTATVLVLDAYGATESTLVAADFNVYPLNTTTKNEIRLASGSLRRWPTRSRSISVTATFAKSASVPADVSLAATKLVAELVNGNLGQGDLSSVSLGDYSLTYHKISVDEAAKKSMSVINILDHYRDITI